MNQILEGTKTVADQSKDVSLDREKIVEYADQFNHGSATHWLSSAPFRFNHLTGEQKLAFLFIFNALSFSYWGEPKWTIEVEGKQFDGSWGMIAALGRAYGDGVPILDFEYCSQVTRDELASILKGNVEIPLLDMRLKILNEIGKIITDKYQGRIRGIVDEAAKNAMRLLDIVVGNFPSFYDSSEYGGVPVLFHKRAQLFVADLYQTFEGVDLGDLRHVDQLTACADYKLPQMLRKLGIMKYSAALADKIDRQIEIIHGSSEEVEIRSNTIWAVELLRREILKKSPDILSIEVNDHLWLMTQEKFSDDKPYHRTRTIAY